MSFNIKTIYFIIATLFLNLLLTSGCSLDDAEITRAPPNIDPEIMRERERQEQYGTSEDDSFIGDLFKDVTGIGDKNKASDSVGIGVNPFLWRATLDTLSFMPLESADPFGGVIITDWYSNSETSTEKFKIIAYIMGKKLRVDAIKVSVFKKIKNSDNEWVDKKTNNALKNKIEDAILTNARKYKIENID